MAKNNPTPTSTPEKSPFPPIPADLVRDLQHVSQVCALARMTVQEHNAWQAALDRIAAALPREGQGGAP